MTLLVRYQQTPLPPPNPSGQPMPIIPVLNLKGGVAKTVTTVALAECFASHGHRVLLVDADHQCMAGELALGESRLLAG
jgi:chromosome partitioning protein